VSPRDVRVTHQLESPLLRVQILAGVQELAEVARLQVNLVLVVGHGVDHGHRTAGVANHLPREEERVGQRLVLVLLHGFCRVFLVLNGIKVRKSFRVERI